MTISMQEDISAKMSELYIAECNTAKARLEVETECRRIMVDQYETVLAQAKEYSKKIEVPILAKICEVGYFCDTHVVRTNQVTMEMGSSYYVECSIHTAEKIVARRIAEMQRQRQDGLDSIRLVDDKIKFAQENFSASTDSGPIEIVEKYDENLEKLFYENRKRRAMNKEEKEKLKRIEEIEGDKEYNEMLSHLEELEKMESANREIETDSEAPIPLPFEVPIEQLSQFGEWEREFEEDEQEITEKELYERLLAQPGVSQKEMERLLDYLNNCEKESSDENDEDDEECEEEENEKKVEELDSDDYASDENTSSDKATSTCTTKTLESVKVEEVIEENTSSATVTKKKCGVRFAPNIEKVKTFHQSDIIKIKEESGIETKSILRNTEPSPVDRSAISEAEQKELSSMSASTFPGQIVEKDPYECEPSTSKDPAPVISDKKFSKFRASRRRKSK